MSHTLFEGSDHYVATADLMMAVNGCPSIACLRAEGVRRV